MSPLLCRIWHAELLWLTRLESTNIRVIIVGRRIIERLRLGSFILECGVDMFQDKSNTSKLHRLAKLFMDTGEAATVQEAEEKLKRYRLGISVDSEVLESPAYQAALLTAINTGR